MHSKTLFLDVLISYSEETFFFQCNDINEMT